jgi:hypothetical protein
MAHTALVRSSIVGTLMALGVGLAAPPASACGGFFCGQQPVDQTAERILFEVGADSVTMTTQISFSGDAADFAWILPLSDVPDPNSLAVYHQQALNALDANTGPNFLLPQDSSCSYGVLNASSPVADAENSGGVSVYIRQEVGDYDVAVIESADPALLIAWLREQGFRITTAMEPYIERYTSEGMKFLALKLQVAATVQDIKPFRFTLPGTAPSIPLRMTALAAEPEMSVVAFVLADGRYEGKNWANLEIDDDQIRINPGFYYGLSGGTNWANLVAQAVDGADGQGWVTEFAGPSQSYADLVRVQIANGNFSDQENALAAAELLAALGAHPYLTRLYTRLSAEEMTSDPVFGRSSLGDVAREHQISRYVNGDDQCPGPNAPTPTSNPCDFTTCGAGGTCRPVASDSNLPPYYSDAIAGCACVPGATARTTRGPGGAPSVICQDGRMSFINPGDRETEGGDVVPDACAGFDCGEHGQCVAMNMTPTCVCDQGFVAIGNIDPMGVRTTTCVEPDEPISNAFYLQRLQALPSELPGGRQVDVPSVLPPLPTSSEVSVTGFPVPRGEPIGAARSEGGGDGGCALTARSRSGAGSDSSAITAFWATGALLAASRLRRRARVTR